MTNLVPVTPAPGGIEIYLPSNLDQAFFLAETLLNGRLAVPKGVDNPAAVVTIMMTGAELGLSPMQSLRSIHVFTGRPTLAAELQVGLVKKSAPCKYFQLRSSSDTEATYRTHRVGDPDYTDLTYTIAMAQKAGLTNKDNWKHNPAAMLRARASAALCRAVYPDVTLGILSTEEALDDGTEPTLAPVQLPAADLQSRIATTTTRPANDGEPVAVSEDAVRKAIGAGRDLEAMKATTKDLGARYPGQQKMIRAVFDALKKERAAAAAAAKAEAPQPPPPPPKSEPWPASHEADSEPPADVKLDADDVVDRGDAYEGP